jgi:hypothetical protein
MDYNQLVQTVSLIIENEMICKEGLSLVYTLNDINHKGLQEQLFYKSNPIGSKITLADEFDVEIGGILVNFIKKAPQPVE